MHIFRSPENLDPTTLIDSLFTQPTSDVDLEYFLAQMNALAHILSLIKKNQNMTIDVAIELYSFNPRTIDSNVITHYMRQTFTLEIESYYENLTDCKNQDDKIQLIAQTIQSLSKKNIFDYKNNNLFVFEILNFFLIEEKIGIYTLSDGSRFPNNGLNKSIQTVKKNLFRFDKLTNADIFCNNLLIAILNKIYRSTLHTIRTEIKSMNINMYPNFFLPSPPDIYIPEYLLSLQTVNTYLGSVNSDIIVTAYHFVTIPLLISLDKFVSVTLYIKKDFYEVRELRSVCLIDKQDRNKEERLKIAREVFERLRESYPNSSFNIHRYQLNNKSLSLQNEIEIGFTQALHHCYNRKKRTKIHFVESYQNDELLSQEEFVITSMKQ